MKWMRKGRKPEERKAWGGAYDLRFGGATSGRVPGDYGARVRAAYANPVALRAIRMIAEGVAQVSLTSGGEVHPAADLVGHDFLETVTTHLLLHGNAFVETGLDHHQKPAALWTLRPERMTLETDRRGFPETWCYNIGTGVLRYPAAGDSLRPGLLHLRLINPLDDHMGTGALGAAIEPIALLTQAARWNQALLGNAARPSGALVLEDDGSTLTPEQFDRLKDEIEAAFQGAANAGRPMLLEGGLRWQQLSMTPAEMDFKEARSAAAREVALAFGVPPMLLGLPGDSTHANYSEANVALWRLTILPLLTKILRGLNRHLGRWWPGLCLEPELDQIPALWKDRELLWRHVDAASFLSDDEKREMLGWAPRNCGAE